MSEPIGTDERLDGIEELEAKLRKSALQELSALGQASEAYQAQLAAEAKLAQQDDLVQAAVAAALREAADAVTEWLEEYPWHASLAQDILALIREGGE